MSLGIIIKSPEGIVLAAESRVTLTLTINTPQGNQTIYNNFDNASKILTFNDPNNFIGGCTYGQALIGTRTAQSFIPEFETELKVKHKKRLKIHELAKELSDFYLKEWTQTMPQNIAYQTMVFNIAGFDENEPYGKVFGFEIPKLPNPIELIPPINEIIQFGINWGGQREIVDRLLMGYDLRVAQILHQVGLEDNIILEIENQLKNLNLQIPFGFMPLQDCINLAHLLIKTTINAQELTIGLRGCGGAIDIAIITKDKPFQFIQEKQLSVN